MKKKIITIMLTFVMAFSMLFATSITASAATTGKTGSSTYCTVRINQSLINKRGKQYAKVTLKTYSMGGWFNTGAKVRFTLKDVNGRYITSWIGKGGDTLKLGDDHRIYRIYVSYYNEPAKGGIFSRSITSGNNFINTGKACTWKASNAKDCKIS